MEGFDPGFGLGVPRLSASAPACSRSTSATRSISDASRSGSGSAGAYAGAPLHKHTMVWQSAIPCHVSCSGSVSLLHGTYSAGWSPVIALTLEVNAHQTGLCSLPAKGHIKRQHELSPGWRAHPGGLPWLHAHSLCASRSLWPSMRMSRMRTLLPLRNLVHS